MKYRQEYISTFYSDITQFVSDLQEYPEKAERILSKLDKILLRLVDMPEMYPVYDDVPTFRKIVVEDYLVFYVVDRNKKLIEVHRLLYGKMDVPEQFM